MLGARLGPEHPAQRAEPETGKVAKAAWQKGERRSQLNLQDELSLALDSRLAWLFFPVFHYKEAELNYLWIKYAIASLTIIF